jgi:hypothetical protein
LKHDPAEKHRNSSTKNRGNGEKNLKKTKIGKFNDSLAFSSGYQQSQFFMLLSKPTSAAISFDVKKKKNQKNTSKETQQEATNELRHRRTSVSSSSTHHALCSLRNRSTFLPCTLLYLLPTYKSIYYLPVTLFTYHFAKHSAFFLLPTYHFAKHSAFFFYYLPTYFLLSLILMMMSQGFFFFVNFVMMMMYIAEVAIIHTTI